MGVYSSIMHESRKVETTQMHGDRRMERSVAYPYDGGLMPATTWTSL